MGRTYLSEKVRPRRSLKRYNKKIAQIDRTGVECSRKEKLEERRLREKRSSPLLSR